MRVFSIQHDRQGLPEVERISPCVDDVASRLTSLPEVNGAVVLNTCNRVEVLLDTTGEASNTRLRAALNTAFDTPPVWGRPIASSGRPPPFQAWWSRRSRRHRSPEASSPGRVGG